MVATTNNQEENSNLSIRCHPVEKANILVVGGTGSGKSTFKEVLRNPKHISDYEIDSQTKEAEMTNLLFEINGKFSAVNVIDTPGFGDSGIDSKTNFELEDMILKFIKQGITELNVVLITLRFGVRYEAAQVDTIMNVLRFLGKDMKSNCHILCTFAEGKTKEEKKTWINKAKKSCLSNVFRFCSKKIFFTGMSTSEDPMDRLKFEKEVRKQHQHLLEYSASITPMKLHGEELEKVSSKFKVYESAAKDSLTVQQVLPEIKNELLPKFQRLRAQLFNDHPEHALTKDAINKYNEVNEDTIKKQCAEWSEVQKAIAKYVEDGTGVQNAAKQIRDQHKQLSSAIDDIKRILDKIKLFDDVDDVDKDADEYEFI